MTLLVQPSFTGGEIAPSLQSRVDLEQYAIALKTLRNAYCKPHGGATNRPGSLYIDEVENSAETHRLIPFNYDSITAYALVFGNETLRFIKYSGGVWAYVDSSGSPYEIVSPYAHADLDLLTYTQSANVMYLAHPDYAPYKLSRISDNSWTLAAIDFGDGPYRAVEATDLNITVEPSYPTGLNVRLEATDSLFAAKHVGSPFRLGYMNPNDTSDIQWYYGIIDLYSSSKIARMDVIGDVQLGFQLMINWDFEFGLFGWENASVAPSTAGYYVTSTSLRFAMKTSGLSEVRQEVALKKGTEYLIAIRISSITGAIRIKIGTTTGASDIGLDTSTTAGISNTVFVATQEEVHISVDNTGSADGNYAYISYISLTSNDIATPYFRIGAWNSTDGWPRTVGIHEQRVIYGGTAFYPLTSWLSRTGDFENFTFNSPLLGDDSFNYRFDSGMVFDIQWLLSSRKLMVGTSKQEWVVSGYDTAITPTSINALTEISNGSAPGIPPVVANSTVLHIQVGAKTVQSIGYTLEVDGYSSGDVSIMASHLFEGKTILEWTHSRLPDGIIWCVLSDGTIAGLTFLKEHEIQGWHKHDTNGYYESVCTINVAGTDHTLTIVKRNVDGSDVRYIEVFQERITDEDTYDYFFVDCGMTYDGVATTTITGLDHLEDEEVVALADGEVVKGLTVASGQITLPHAATLVHVGLAYVSDIETLGLHLIDQQRGSSESRLKSIPRCTVTFEKSRGVWIGPDKDHLDEMKFRDEDLGVDEDPIALYTGNKGITFNSGYDEEGRVFIRNTDPIPLTVLSIIPDVAINDD